MHDDDLDPRDRLIPAAVAAHFGKRVTAGLHYPRNATDREARCFAGELAEAINAPLAEVLAAADAIEAARGLDRWPTLGEVAAGAPPAPLPARRRMTTAEARSIIRACEGH